MCGHNPIPSKQTAFPLFMSSTTLDSLLLDGIIKESLLSLTHTHSQKFEAHISGQTAKGASEKPSQTPEVYPEFNL